MNDLEDSLETPTKYKVFISTDGKMTIEFEAQHSHEIENTLQSLTGVWATLKRMSSDTKANGIKAVNEAIKPVTKMQSWCEIHQVAMQGGVSQKTGKAYSYHDLPEGRCFGRGVKPKSIGY